MPASKSFARQQTWESTHQQGHQLPDACSSGHSVPSKLRAALSRSDVFSDAHSECSHISFVLRDAWNERLSEGNLVRHTTTNRYTRQASDLGEQISSSWRKLYLSPGSAVRLGWGSCGLLLLLYDVATIPMLVFEPPPSLLLTVGAWVTQVFWTIDLVSNFFVGYYDKGNLIMSPPKIALRYLRTTFLLDLTIVGVDWIFYAVGDGEESSAGFMRLVKTGRALRFFRMVRLVRLVRTQQFLQQVNRYISTEIASVRCGIMKLFIQLCLLSHLIACGWYSIAVVKGIDSQTWVKAAGIIDAPFEYRYIIALHCTLAQLGVGVTNIVPTNFLEAVYAVFVMFLAIIAVSSLIGSITTLMALLQSTREEEAHDFWLLKKYCVDHEISKDLSDRVRKYIEYIQHRKSRVNDTDIPLFKMLTEPLQLELQYERYAPKLKPHQFFRKLITSSYLESRRNGSSNVMQRVCNDSVTSIPLARQDVLFCAGEDASRMYVLDEGELEYDHRGCLQRVGFTHWISEAALWTPWIHVGELHARTECQLIALDAARFSGIIARHPDLWVLAKKYAEHFVLVLNSAGPEVLSDLNEEGLDHVFTSTRQNVVNFRLFRLAGQ